MHPTHDCNERVVYQQLMDSLDVTLRGATQNGARETDTGEKSIVPEHNCGNDVRPTRMLSCCAKTVPQAC